ncbi:MAG: aminotransferase class IV [Acidobacteria bacterium]|nr:aminotransferase class IV [Acidobacteriota bacterium]
MHRFLLHNGQIHDTSAKLVTPGQVGLLNGWGVFSTLRVMDGVLFAWERHYARMRKDAALMHIPFPQDAGVLRDSLIRLVEANEAFNSTLRVAVVRNKGGMFESPGLDNEYDVIAFTKDLADWGAGVTLAVQERARMSSAPFSGAKILSWSMNLTWLEEAQRRGFQEMLLLDDHGLVSECTSANIFAVHGTRVSTPPLTCGCLPGVTRAVLLEDIRVDGLNIEERELRMDDLASASELFITSSTRDLLPVLAIEGISVQQGREVRGRLNDAFQQYLCSYVSQSRSVLN